MTCSAATAASGRTPRSSPSTTTVASPGSRSTSAGSCLARLRRDRVARLRALAGLGRLDLAVLGRGRGDELGQQPLGDLGDGVDRAVKRLVVGLRRLGEAADLADVLQRGGAHLVLAGRRR